MDASDTGNYIFRTSITLKNGKRIFASQYGLKAFKIKISKKKTSKKD